MSADNRRRASVSDRVDHAALARQMAGTSPQAHEPDEPKSPPRLGGEGDSPEPAPQSQPPATPAERRAQAVGEAIDNACSQVVAEIDGLIERATALREWYIDDAARTKAAIKTHIGAGSRVVELTSNIKDELAALEANRDEILNAQTKG